MRKSIVYAFMMILLAVLLASCGSKVYADGTYEGKSQVYQGDEEGNGDGYGVAVVVIKDNQITSCQFHTYQIDGILKDKEYGKKQGAVANADYYNKAQRAVMACGKYAQALTQTGKLKDVDVISGATISYNEFKEAVKEALDKARK